MLTAFVHAEALVDPQWVQLNLDNPVVKIVEVDVDTQAYDAGHIPGAIGFNWQTQLQDPVRRDIIGKEDFEALLGRSGISDCDTVVLYGDSQNWFAAYAFWLFKLYGHRDVRLMDGGRIKWLEDQGKPLTAEKPRPEPVRYTAAGVDASLRAMLPEVLEASRTRVRNLIDVRSPDEFTGRIIAPAGMMETAQRGGHIPGAVNVPWSQAVNPDGTFKSPEELAELYRRHGVRFDRPTITYCRIGERSSHTWFVLKYLLGVEEVQNYDGSWTEYGNVVGVPIEK